MSNNSNACACNERFGEFQFSPVTPQDGMIFHFTMIRWSGSQILYKNYQLFEIDLLKQPQYKHSPSFSRKVCVCNEAFSHICLHTKKIQYDWTKIFIHLKIYTICQKMKRKEWGYHKKKIGIITKGTNLDCFHTEGIIVTIATLDIIGS